MPLMITDMKVFSAKERGEKREKTPKAANLLNSTWNRENIILKIQVFASWWLIFFCISQWHNMQFPSVVTAVITLFLFSLSHSPHATQVQYSRSWQPPPHWRASPPQEHRTLLTHLMLPQLPQSPAPHGPYGIHCTTAKHIPGYWWCMCSKINTHKRLGMEVFQQDKTKQHTHTKGGGGVIFLRSHLFQGNK